MPVSEMSNVSPIMAEVARLNPRSVLDAGIGYGKYGCLCRELLDVARGRPYPEQWITTIFGVEGFPAYKNAIHAGIYSQVWYEDFAVEALKGSYTDFSLVLMVDSLEHIDKPEGEKVLDILLQHNKHVIVSCPTGRNYLPQGAVYGNEFERHRAHWVAEDFTIRGGRIIHSDVCVVASIKGYR